MFAVNLAMVSVDMKTFKAHCEKFVLCGDVGVINNYLVVDDQQYGITIISRGRRTLSFRTTRLLVSGRLVRI